MINQIICGDVLEVLSGMPDDSVSLVATSPPYWGLRDYNLPPTIWDDGWEGCLGLEPDMFSFIDHLISVFREVKRVLHPTGVCFVNIADSYAGGASRGDSPPQGKQSTNKGTDFLCGKSAIIPPGLKSKNMCLIPERFVIAMQQDGWWVRDKPIWAKAVSCIKEYSGSTMPSSATDRCTPAYENIYHFTKRGQYFWDAEAVRENQSEASATVSRRKYKLSGHSSIPKDDLMNIGKQYDKFQEATDHKHNLRNVWVINPQPTPEAHFATFPERLVGIMVKAGSSEHGICGKCRAPYVRIVESEIVETPRNEKGDYAKGFNDNTCSYLLRTDIHGSKVSKTIGWRSTCNCNAERVPAVVMDIFGGTGTSAYVARKLGRSYISIDLSEKYCEQSRKRLAQGVLL